MGLCAQAADKRKEGQLECRGGEERQWGEGKVEGWGGRDNEKKKGIKQKAEEILKNAKNVCNGGLKQQERGKSGKTDKQAEGEVKEE